MSKKKMARRFGFEVLRFRNVNPDEYNGTWYWNAGDDDGFCFFIEASSHTRDYKAEGKPYSGPIIATKAEAMKQGRAAAAKLQKEYDAK